MHRVRPPALIYVKQGERPESEENAKFNMMKWCRITAIAIDLSDEDIQADVVGRLVAVLGQCASLAHLDLYWSTIEFHHIVTAEHQVLRFKGTFGHSLPATALATAFDVRLAGDAQTLERGDEGVGPLSNSF